MINRLLKLFSPKDPPLPDWHKRITEKFLDEYQESCIAGPEEFFYVQHTAASIKKNAQGESEIEWDTITKKGHKI